MPFLRNASLYNLLSDGESMNKMWITEKVRKSESREAGSR